jgi:hypothetical protein
MQSSTVLSSADGSKKIKNRIYWNQSKKNHKQTERDGETETKKRM